MQISSILSWKPTANLPDLADLLDLEVDFYFLLLSVLIIWNNKTNDHLLNLNFDNF